MYVMVNNHAGGTVRQYSLSDQTKLEFPEPLNGQGVFSVQI